MNRGHGGTAIDPTVAHPPPSIASDRAFGWLMTAVATAIAAYAHFYTLPWVWWPIVIGAVFALLSILMPSALAALNRAWMRLGMLLGRIVTPLVMGLIYFGLVTPIAVLARMRGVDPMRKRFDPTTSTYWLERQPPGPDPATMPRQY